LRQHLHAVPHIPLLFQRIPVRDTIAVLLALV